MDLNKYRSYHFIGIGGMGMRALARILINKGFNVSGSDISDSPALSEFKNHGASIYIGHKKENIENADVIIISSAFIRIIRNSWRPRQEVSPFFTGLIY